MSATPYRLQAPIDPPPEDPLDGETCTICDGTGEVWVDIELPSGQIREACHDCGCGS